MEHRFSRPFCWLVFILACATALRIQAQTDDDSRGLKRAASSEIAPLGDAPDHNAALFVGVNHFTEDDSLRDLNFAVNDAVAQAHLFVLELKLIPAGSCYLSLSGTPSDDDSKKELDELTRAGAHQVTASKAEVLRSLLLVERSAETPADLVIVSVSTHGFEQNGQAYAMPSDGLRGVLEDTAINIATIESKLADSHAGKRLLLIDACREKVSNDSKGGDIVMSPAFRQALAASQGQAVLASCDAGQISYENPNLHHGVFTYYLIEALRGRAAANAQGFITLGAVSDYVASGVNDWVTKNKLAADQSSAQRPWFKGPTEIQNMPLAVDPGVKAKEQARVQALQKLFENGQITPDQYAEARKLLTSAASDDVALKRAKVYSDLADGKLSPDYLAGALNAIGNSPSRDASISPNPAPSVAPGELKFVPIPTGTFLMGSPPDEPGHAANELLHRVTLTHGFSIANTCVTRAQFSEFVKDTGYKTGGERVGWIVSAIGPAFGQGYGLSWRNPGFKQSGDDPVVGIDSDDAQAYCQWLGRKDGKHYRLPTEAEWEYACRAGTTTAYNTGAGEAALDQSGWYITNSGDNPLDWQSLLTHGGIAGYLLGAEANHCRTHPVALKKPNAWGLYDMHGNVAEWCADWYADYPAGDVTDPHGPDFGTIRVARAGGCGFKPEDCRSARRGGGAQDFRSNWTGFRVVMDGN